MVNYKFNRGRGNKILFSPICTSLRVAVIDIGIIQ